MLALNVAYNRMLDRTMTSHDREVIQEGRGSEQKLQRVWEAVVTTVKAVSKRRR